MELEEEIRNSFENRYHSPFTVKKTYSNGEPCFCITPTNNFDGLFSIIIKFENNVRLIAELKPQEHSGNFFRTIGMEPDESKKQFLEGVNLLEERDTEHIIRVNGQTLNTKSLEDWPRIWKSIEVKISKFPIAIKTENDYAILSEEYGFILFNMFRPFLEIEYDLNEVSYIGRIEGKLLPIEINRYERNLKNREACIKENGYNCKICGFNFEKIYGNLGERFIEVHHIVPVSEIGENYIINPIHDLIPVCSNCHAMLHRYSPPLKPEELKKILDEQKLYP